MESDIMRVMFQGIELSMRTMKGSAQALLRIAAFLKAASDKQQMGDLSLKKILNKGEGVYLGKMPAEKLDELKTLSKEYGFAYHSVDCKDGTVDIMFRGGDLPKFNAIFERMGLGKPQVDEYTVDDARGSVMDKLHDLAKKQQTRPAKHRITDMEMNEIREAVKGINKNDASAMTPENWQAYLEVQALLYDYSAKNKERIAQQQPDATLVMSNTRWKALGREKTGDANGIEIIMPELADGKQTGKYVGATVYDISETSGAEADMDSYFVRINSSELDSRIKTLSNSGVTVRVEDALETDAIFDPASNMILLNKNLDRDQKFKALQREHVFAKAFAGQGEKFKREDHAFLAQSVTYAISTKFGIDASEYSFENLPASADVATIRETLNRELLHYSQEFKKSVIKTKAQEVGGR